MLKKHLQKILLLFIALGITSLQATQKPPPKQEDNSIGDDYIMPQVEKEPVDDSVPPKNIEDKKYNLQDIKYEIKIIQDLKDQLEAKVIALVEKNIRVEKEKKRNCTLCSILLTTVVAISSGVRYLSYNPLQKRYNILNDRYNSLNGSYNAIEHDYNICKNASNKMLNAIAGKYNISTIAFTWDLELPQHPDQ